MVDGVQLWSPGGGSPVCAGGGRVYAHGGRRWGQLSRQLPLLRPISGCGLREGVTRTGRVGARFTHEGDRPSTATGADWLRGRRRAAPPLPHNLASGAGGAPLPPAESRASQAVVTPRRYPEGSSGEGRESELPPSPTAVGMRHGLPAGVLRLLDPGVHPDRPMVDRSVRCRGSGVRSHLGRCSTPHADSPSACGPPGPGTEAGPVPKPVRLVWQSTTARDREMPVLRPVAGRRLALLVEEGSQAVTEPSEALLDLAQLA
jgi:hypothetical protein